MRLAHNSDNAQEHEPELACLNGIQAHDPRCSRQGPTKRRDGQLATNSQFKVRCVVSGELVLASEHSCTYEHLRPARIFHGDRQVREAFEEGKCFLARKATFSDRQFDHIGHFV